MANFTNDLRGDGLARVHGALGRLEGDPLQLNRARAPVITMHGLFGRSVTNLSESGISIRNPSTAESNHRQGSSVTNTSQQGPSADIDSPGLENGDAERPPPVSNSSRPSSGRRVLRPTTGQALWPSKRKPSHKDGQPASASLGPVRSSKVSKAPGKKKPGSQWRPNISPKVSSGGLPLSPSVDAAQPQPLLVPENLRKSPRLQPPIPSVAKDFKGTTRLKSEQNIADNMTARGSAKPKGISKRPSAKTTHNQCSVLAN